MRKYSLKEIKYLWRLYGTPVFKASNPNIDGVNVLMPGSIIIDKDISEFYRYNKEMSFPEFIEFMEDQETDRLMKKLKE